MSKVKIYSNIGAWRGTKVAFSKGRELNFDANGASEVDSDLGLGLLQDYKGMLFSQEIPKTVEQEKSEEKYVKIINELQKAVKERDTVIQKQKESAEIKLQEAHKLSEEWREKAEKGQDPTVERVAKEEFDKVCKELEELKEAFQDGDLPKGGVKLSSEDLEGVKELMSSNSDVLKEMAKSLGVKEDVYSKLGKVDLTIMLIDRTVNAKPNV